MYFLLASKIVKIHGQDGENFLQGQLTCNVKTLTEGSSTITAHCNAQGKVESIFRLYRESSQVFYAIFPTELADHGLKNLQKYAIFSKVEFTNLPWQVLGSIKDNLPSGAEFELNFAENLKLGVFSTAVNYDLAKDLTPWQAQEMLAGYPQLTMNMVGKFIPQALNLENLEQAMSFNKGCYIGQETIARAKYRGANKLKMLLLQGSEHMDTNTPLEIQQGDHWRITGTIIHQLSLDQGCLVQAVLNPTSWESETPHFRCGKVQLRLKD